MVFLAIRHLLSRKKQTLLILSGIGLGTAIFIFISAIQLGFRNYIIRQLIENDGHIKVTGRDESLNMELVESWFFPQDLMDVTRLWFGPPAGKRSDSLIKNPISWFQFLSESPQVAGFAEVYSTQTVVSRGSIKRSLNLIGINPDRHRMVTLIEENVNLGQVSDLSGGGPNIILGAELMRDLGVQMAETVFVTSAKGSLLPMRVVGQYSSGMRGQDRSIGYANISQVTRIAGQPGRVSSIIVRLFDVNDARGVASDWASFSEDAVESWDQANAQFLDMTKIQDWTRHFITSGIILVAAFGIYNVLSIIVTQKRREIAILRSMGYQAKQILELFLLQGLTVGFLGSLIGLILGWGISELVIVQFQKMGSMKMTVEIDSSLYLQGIVLALSSSLIASFIPALSASRMNPIDIIREE